MQFMLKFFIVSVLSCMVLNVTAFASTSANLESTQKATTIETMVVRDNLKAQRSILYVQSRYFSQDTPFPRLAPHLDRQVLRKPVIYIDAGHGGRDPGAIGVKGTHEKTITTKASQTLKVMLEKTGRYKVVLTRPNDIYLDHEKRLRLAREGGADLFISIHADSASNKQAKGASVYTLSDRAKNRSKRLVSKSQNWIMDVDLSKQSDPVGDILVDLAQRKTESQSELFADILLAELAKSTDLVGNSHRRAGYFVLLAPDVPAVLLELGFLSNATDEKLLNKASHRQKLMRSVVRSIDQYFVTADK
jgi:N-acetylmuramoyl-L-alanine amidase